MIRALGFSHVCEVGFGADMVAREYRKLHDITLTGGSISSDCPAIVFFIEHYQPNLIDKLAPIASPMVAMTRIVRKKYGNDSKVIFIGPCIAKKAESDEVDEVLTFTELRELFKERKLIPEKITPSDFDPPHACKGSIFPVSRGMLQTIELSEDILTEDVIVASGKNNFREVIKEFENDLDSNFFDSLAKHFSKDYEDLQNSIEFIIKDLKKEKLANIPEMNVELYADLRNDYEASAKRYNEIVKKQNYSDYSGCRPSDK